MEIKYKLKNLKNLINTNFPGYTLKKLKLHVIPGFPGTIFKFQAIPAFPGVPAPPGNTARMETSHLISS